MLRLTLHSHHNSSYHHLQVGVADGCRPIRTNSRQNEADFDMTGHLAFVLRGFNLTGCFCCFSLDNKQCGF